MMNRLKLGDRITISKRLLRVRETVRGVNDVKKYIPSYQKRYWSEKSLKAPIEVLVIGKRTLKNGKVWYEQENGWVFYPDETVKAYLVVKDMNTKPFYIDMSNF